jgi:hypothetical protein
MLRGARALAAAAVAAGACTVMVGVANASAATTPGWECIPTAAGQAVVSGGTGTNPSCSAGTTPVLAPTFISSGVGGKPTVAFSGVNVQVVSGSGSTGGAVNGEGNLILGYAENPNAYAQTGSNDLIVGSGNGWKGYGEIVGGFKNQVTNNYATAVGEGNAATGTYSLAAGEANKASGTASTVIAGEHNQASGQWSGVGGGEYNLASDPFSAVSAGCQGVTGTGSTLSGSCASSGGESISGGALNRASGLFSSVSAGQQNQANGTLTAVSGGDHNTAGSPGNGNFASVTGGGGNLANGDESAIAGGQYNETTDDDSFVVGGCDNLAGSGTAQAGDCVNSDSGLEDGHDAILGGLENATTGFGSSISGGENNAATGQTSSILGGNGVSVSATDKTAPTGVIGSVTGSVGFTLGANACGGFSVGDGALQVGDVPLFAYTTTPPSHPVLFTPGAVTTAGTAAFTACNDSSSSVTFSGSLHVVAFRG